MSNVIRQGNELVSVVVPVYNVEKYISRCIESILAQTYEHLELILVNDGSADQSGAICDKYAAKDNRITVIHQANAGVSNARNAGIDRAKGNYLFFVDSDDWIEPNHLECLLPVGEEECVYGGRKFFVNGRFVEERAVPACVVQKDEWLEDYSRFASRGLTLFFISPCYRMDIINKYGVRFNTELQISEDGLFNLAYMQHCNSIRYTDACTYCYEDGDDSSVSLSHRFHPMRLVADMQKCLKIEELTHKAELEIRWKHWHGIIRHYRKWQHFNNGVNQYEATRLLKECYKNQYFRASIPFMRKHGTLDEKIETFFMSNCLHPLYKPMYNVVVLLSKIKNYLLRK